MKKNKATIRQLRKLTQQSMISISINLCFNDSEHFIQIQQKKIETDKNKNYTINAKIIIKWIDDLKSKTINFDEKTKLTNVFEKIFDNNEIQKNYVNFEKQFTQIID